MDDFSAFVCTASTSTELPPSDGSPAALALPAPVHPKKRTISAEALSAVAQVAAAVLVVGVLAAAALWEKAPASRRRTERRPLGVTVAKPATKNAPVAAKPVKLVSPLPPAYGGTFVSYDTLPDFGGAPDPEDEYDIENLIVEDEYRERLRREGKLLPEPGSVEDLRQRIETLRDKLVRIAN